MMMQKKRSFKNGSRDDLFPMTYSCAPIITSSSQSIEVRSTMAGSSIQFSSSSCWGESDISRTSLVGNRSGCVMKEEMDSPILTSAVWIQWRNGSNGITNDEEQPTPMPPNPVLVIPEPVNPVPVIPEPVSSEPVSSVPWSPVITVLASTAPVSPVLVSPAAVSLVPIRPVPVRPESALKQQGHIGSPPNPKIQSPSTKPPTPTTKAYSTEAGTQSHQCSHIGDELKEIAMSLLNLSVAPLSSRKSSDPHSSHPNHLTAIWTSPIATPSKASRRKRRREMDDATGIDLLLKGNYK